jgi:hypothetical protein
VSKRTEKDMEKQKENAVGKYGKGQIERYKGNGRADNRTGIS